jgi:ABC-2 type transport system ATP-binding protein
MMHQPRLLLMDEPTSGLDPAARLEFWETIESLRAQESVTVLMTTHFLDEAERCDRLLLVDQGKEVAEGTPAELRSDLGDAVLRVRCHGVQQAEAFRKQLLERLECKIEQSADQLLIDRLDAEVDWRGWLDEFPQQVRELSWARPTLEDLFLRKTGRSLAGDPASLPTDRPGTSRRRQGGTRA